jgi:L-amino acid N-acyltransferase YncA
MSRDSDVVPWEAHAAWFSNRLSDPDTIILIGVKDSQPIGVVRFERHAGVAAVSINIAPCARDLGLGKDLLLRGCEYAEQTGFTEVFEAEIRANNSRSRHIFDAVGFIMISSDLTWTLYQRRRGPPRTEMVGP